jgi:hypothetical protein
MARGKFMVASPFRTGEATETAAGIKLIVRTNNGTQGNGNTGPLKGLGYSKASLSVGGTVNLGC